MNFEKGQRFQTVDGKYWLTVTNVFDTSKIKDKTYRALRAAFYKGSRYTITVVFDGSGNTNGVQFNEISLAKIINPTNQNAQ